VRIRRLARAAVLLAVAAGLHGCAQPPEPVAEDWRTFEGSWTAVGTRRSLPTEGGGTAAILHMSGAVVLRLGGGLGRGFRGEALGFDDGHALRVGRWVWTDDRGDQVFGTATGERVASGRRFEAAITGGTGRYTGITGEFSFTWQEMVAEDRDAFHVRTDGLRGRYRRAGGQP
jgi:hypothetical protein